MFFDSIRYYEVIMWEVQRPSAGSSEAFGGKFNGFQGNPAPV